MGEKSQLQGKKMIKDLTKKMFLLESSDGASSAGGSAVLFMVMMTMSTILFESAGCDDRQDITKKVSPSFRYFCTSHLCKFVLR